jgi:hypothetical protein
MIIKQSVINTFNRVGIDYKKWIDFEEKWEISNRFTGERVTVKPLISVLIQWVYKISNQYEVGNQEVKISDFDRIRYFILEQDSNAYFTCID